MCLFRYTDLAGRYITCLYWHVRGCAKKVKNFNEMLKTDEKVDYSGMFYYMKPVTAELIKRIACVNGFYICFVRLK